MMPRQGVTAWPLLALLLTAGCAALPDVSPFSAASRQLAAAVKTSGTAISDDLHAAQGVREAAEKFDRAWAARNQTMQAVVDYSDALGVIVSSAARARESAGALADKIGGLARVAGLVQPGAGAAVSVATDAAKFVWAQIALVRGASALEEALVNAQPAIDRIADHIMADNRDLALVVQGVAQRQRGELAAKYNEVVAYAASLGKHRGALRGKDFASLTSDEKAEMARLDALMAPADVELRAFEDARTQVAKRERATLQLIAATKDAMDRWAAAHAAVVQAVRQRRPVSVESLADAAVELRGLVKRVQEL